MLACGVEVDAGWTTAPLRHFCHLDIAAVGAVLIGRDDPNTIISAGVGYRLEGTAWRIGGQNTADNRKTLQRNFCGPDTLAAFYRKSAIEAVGGLSASADHVLASADLAMALMEAGFHCVLEPCCEVRVDVATISRPWAFRQGYYAERLFWRWASSRGWIFSLAAHVAMIAGQLVVSVWRPSMVVQLFGRACAVVAASLPARRTIADASVPSEEILPSTASRVPAANIDKRRSARAA